MGKKTVVKDDGSIMFFKAIMDEHLIRYMQPFFKEDTRYWSKVLKIPDQVKIMDGFVDGEILKGVRTPPPPDPGGRSPLLGMSRLWTR